MKTTIDENARGTRWVRLRLSAFVGVFIAQIANKFFRFAFVTIQSEAKKKLEKRPINDSHVFFLNGNCAELMFYLHFHCCHPNAANEANAQENPFFVNGQFAESSGTGKKTNFGYCMQLSIEWPPALQDDQKRIAASSIANKLNQERTEENLEAKIGF